MIVLTGTCYLNLDAQICKMDTGTPKPFDLADHLGNNLAENQGLSDIGTLRDSMIVLTGICYLNLDTQICGVHTDTPKLLEPADHLGNNLAENQGLSDIGTLRGSIIVLTGICYLNLDTQICKVDTGTPKPLEPADHLGNNLAENQGLSDIDTLDLADQIVP